MRDPAEVHCMQSFIADELAARGWKTEDAAVRMGTKRGAAMDLFILDIVMCVPDEKLLIEDDFFEGLGRAFDVSADFFRNLHAAWTSHPDRRVPFECAEDIFGPTSRRAMLRVVK